MRGCIQQFENGFGRQSSPSGYSTSVNVIGFQLDKLDTTFETASATSTPPAAGPSGKNAAAAAAVRSSMDDDILVCRADWLWLVLEFGGTRSLPALVHRMVNCLRLPCNGHASLLVYGCVRSQSGRPFTNGICSLSKIETVPGDVHKWMVHACTRTQNDKTMHLKIARMTVGGGRCTRGRSSPNSAVRLIWMGI